MNCPICDARIAEVITGGWYCTSCDWQFDQQMQPVEQHPDPEPRLVDYEDENDYEDE